MASQLPLTALRGKKRPNNPPVSAAPPNPGSGGKKKKGAGTATPAAPTHVTVTAVETGAEVKAVGAVDSGLPAPSESTAKPPPFKDPTFMHSGIGGAAAGKKNRTWKNLKQILALRGRYPGSSMTLTISALMHLPP
ncbi:hypothetical protein Q5P01_011188 [Channa striata]|uniref:INO80 complex subunit C n=1 Tax=Channa striata TaxID=64152 RepID=A0AA88SVE3_CHASR|nr:hypothetical protein Q5P01_011188 [Channa striata]